MLRFGYDETRGQIIGGNYEIGRIFYDGRQQGGDFTAETTEELKAIAEKKVAELKAEFCGHPCYLYPDNSKWELRY